MNTQEEDALTEVAILIEDVYGWCHEVNDLEAKRLITALDIIEHLFATCQVECRPLGLPVSTR